VKHKSHDRVLARLLVSIPLLLVLLCGMATAQETTQEDRIAALKESMAASQEALQHYEWTETTVVTYDGNEVSRTQARCVHTSDGKVAKEPMGEPQEKKSKRGLRGRHAKKKKAQISDYMEQVKALVATYVPPCPEKIQKCKDAGTISVEMVEAGKRVILRLADYNMPGDSIGIEVDLATNTALSYEVASYIGSASDAVNLDVHLDKLEDATIYPAKISLEAKAEDITAEILNSDYKASGN